MNALITGSRGFVGGYLRRELEQNGYHVIGADIAADEGLRVIAWRDVPVTPDLVGQSGGALDHETLAPMVADLFLGGLTAVRLPVSEAAAG